MNLHVNRFIFLPSKIQIERLSTTLLFNPGERTQHDLVIMNKITKHVTCTNPYVCVNLFCKRFGSGSFSIYHLFREISDMGDDTMQIGQVFVCAPISLLLGGEVR